MTKFNVITTKQKGKPNYELIYLNIAIQALKGLEKEPEDKVLRNKYIFAGVRYFTRAQFDKHDTEGVYRLFGLMEHIKWMIASLTPRELMQVFPPTKDFKGHKYESKDYFSTMEALQEHGFDTVIGDKIDNLLWDYMNWDICRFVVNGLSLISAIRRLDGELGLMEQFAEDKGLSLSTMHTDEKGRMFLTDGKTGETKRVYKKRPRYLQVVN